VIVLRILSLDDEPELVMLMGLIFEHAGYEYVGTDDNYTAWALLHAEPFDLLTQDLMRPDIDGWEFLRLLRSEPSLDRVPVIIITAKTQNLDELAKESDADGYVTKPWRPSELLSQVARVLTARGYRPPAPEAWQAVRATLRRTESFEARLSFLHDPGMRRYVLISLRYDQQTSGYLDQVVPALRPSMDDPDRDVRLAVAKTLGALNHPDALDLLVQLWGDPDQGVRREALRAISAGGDARAADLLMDVLCGSDWQLRWMAALGLSRLQHWPSVEPLLQALRDPAPCLRMMAARALGAFDDKVCAETLTATLVDPDRMVRDVSWQALSAMNNPSAIKRLVAALDDPSIDQAVNIIIWAGRSGNEGLLPRLRQIASTDTRQTHWGTLATLAQYTVNSIEAAAKRRDRQPA
jgi:DNA-binding response OmpR family regulator